MNKILYLLTLITINVINAQENKWETYIGATYTIKYPTSSNFIRIDSPNSDFSLINKDKNVNLRENIIVTIFYNINSTEYESKMEFAKKGFENQQKLILYKKTNNNGNEVYHVKVKEKINGITIIGEQFYWNKNNNIYKLSYAYGDKKNNVNRDIGLKILNSLKIK